MVIDRIERNQDENIVVCEIEDVEMDDEIRITNPFGFECFMADIPEHMFTSRGLTPVEQEIYAVYHENECIHDICSLNPYERDAW